MHIYSATGIYYWGQPSCLGFSGG